MKMGFHYKNVFCLALGMLATIALSSLAFAQAPMRYESGHNSMPMNQPMSPGTNSMPLQMRNYPQRNYSPSPGMPMGRAPMAIPNAAPAPYINNAESNPAMDRMQQRIYGPPSQTMKSPADVEVEFGNARNKLQQAIRTKDYESIGSGSNDIRTKANGLRQELAPNLPLEDRLKLPLLERDYRQGADMIEQGRSKKNEMKINQGLQQIDRANNELKQLNPPGRNKKGNRKN